MDAAWAQCGRVPAESGTSRRAGKRPTASSVHKSGRRALSTLPIDQYECPTPDPSIRKTKSLDVAQRVLNHLCGPLQPEPGEAEVRLSVIQADQNGLRPRRRGEDRTLCALDDDLLELPLVERHSRTQSEIDRRGGNRGEGRRVAILRHSMDDDEPIPASDDEGPTVRETGQLREDPLELVVPAGQGGGRGIGLGAQGSSQAHRASSRINVPRPLPRMRRSRWPPILDSVGPMNV